jgi:hypothetical protein
MNFKNWVEGVKTTTVSFDFDGVLHKDVIPGTLHPKSYYKIDLDPNDQMLAKVREEAKTNNVVIVSARPAMSQDVIEKFIKNHNLPIERVYTTDDRPKLPLLLKLGVVRHYDDNPKIRNSLEDSGIEFVLVQ